MVNRKIVLYGAFSNAVPYEPYHQKTRLFSYSEFFECKVVNIFSSISFVGTVLF